MLMRRFSLKVRSDSLYEKLLSMRRQSAVCLWTWRFLYELQDLFGFLLPSGTKKPAFNLLFLVLCLFFYSCCSCGNLHLVLCNRAGFSCDIMSLKLCLHLTDFHLKIFYSGCRIQTWHVWHSVLLRCDSDVAARSESQVCYRFSFIVSGAVTFSDSDSVIPVVWVLLSETEAVSLAQCSFSRWSKRATSAVTWPWRFTFTPPRNTKVSTSAAASCEVDDGTTFVLQIIFLRKSCSTTL